MTEQPVIPPVEAKPAQLPSRLANAARRARYAIFWERVWPPLAALATAAGLFLALSWLGLWLWLPPLGRAAAPRENRRRHYEFAGWEFKPDNLGIRQKRAILRERPVRE